MIRSTLKIDYFISYINEKIENINESEIIFSKYVRL